nr:DUF5776 domain-containing protein [Lentilactobacillus buchneri]
MKTSRLIYISFLTTLLFGISGIAVKADTIDSAGPKIEKVPMQQNQTITLTDDDVSIEDGIITDVENEDLARQLLQGGHLVVPATLQGETVTGIGPDAFSTDNLSTVGDIDEAGVGIPEYRGIKAVTFEAPNQIKTIDYNAFYGNQLTSIDLPGVTTIGDESFTGNELTSVSPPNVQTVGKWAFTNNKLTRVDLPKATQLATGAFSENRLTSISLGQADIEMSARAFGDQFQIPTGPDENHLVLVSKDLLPVDVVTKDPLTWAALTKTINASFKIAGVEQINPDHVDVDVLANDTDVTVAKVKNDQNKRQMTDLPKPADTPNQFTVIMHYEAQQNDGLGENATNPEPIHRLGGYDLGAFVKVVKQPEIPVVPPVKPSQPRPTNPQTTPTPNRSSESIGAAESPTTAVSQPGAIPTPDHPLAQKNQAVYAVKTINLYKDKDMQSRDRIATYTKKPRINRPMFVVTKQVKASNGQIVYAVRDVNHHSTTAGKTGYITSDWAFVRPVYYQSNHQQLTVINPTGVNEYTHKNLTGKVKNLKQGTKLKVKGFIKYHLTTRYLLSNGHYVTGNRKMVTAEKYQQPKKVKIVKATYLYSNTNFDKHVKQLKTGTILKVNKVVYAHPYSLRVTGSQRFQVKGGYVTASPKYVHVSY